MSNKFIVAVLALMLVSAAVLAVVNNNKTAENEIGNEPIVEDIKDEPVLDENVKNDNIGTVETKKCLVTGCSSQICSDQEVISTCEYREEYACYKDAVCEVQSNGECGWTLDEKLNECLNTTANDDGL